MNMTKNTFLLLLVILICKIASTLNPFSWSSYVIPLIEKQPDTDCEDILTLLYDENFVEGVIEDNLEESERNQSLFVSTPTFSSTLLHLLHSSSSLAPLYVHQFSNNSFSGSELPVERNFAIHQACAVVALAPSADAFTSTAGLLQEIPSWTPRAPHLITITGRATAPQVKELLRHVWRSQLARTAVLWADESADVWISAGNPFTPGRRCTDAGHASPYATNVTRVGEERLRRVRREVFPPRGVRHFRGCTMKVSAYPWTAYTMKDEAKGPHDGFDEGLDVRIVREAAKKMDFVYEYLPDSPDYGSTGTQVINGSGDLALGALILMDDFFNEMDPSDSYWTEPIVWWVPRGAPIPRSLAIAFVFSARLWLHVAASLLLAVLAFAAVQDHGRPPPAQCGIAERSGARCGEWRSALRRAPVLWVYVILLCGSVPQQPSDGLYRAVFLAWVLGAFVLNTAYQSALVGFLANPGTFHEIADVEELLASALIPGLSSEITEVLSDLDDPQYSRFMSRARTCDDATRCLDRAAFARDMVVPIDKSFVSVLYESAGRNLLKPLAVLSNYNLLMYLSKHNPLLDAFNANVRGLVEGGLVALWWSQLTDDPWTKKPEDPGPQVMTLLHLQGAFALLGLGLTASALCFLYERCTCRRQRRRRRHRHQRLQRVADGKKQPGDATLGPESRKP